MRIFKRKSYYYYRTREGMDVGPFDKEEQALKSINDYIENFVGKVDDSVLERISSNYSNDCKDKKTQKEKVRGEARS